MGYPRDLDDYSEAELHAELKRREKLRRAGKCDYCKQVPKGDGSTCSRPARHNDERIRDLHRCCELSPASHTVGCPG